MVLPASALTVIQIAARDREEGSILYYVDVPSIGIHLQLDLRRAEIAKESHAAVLTILTEAAVALRGIANANGMRAIHSNQFNPAALGAHSLTRGFNANRGATNYRMSADSFCGSTIQCELRTGVIMGEDYAAAMNALATAVQSCKALAVHVPVPGVNGEGQFAHAHI